MTTSTKTATRQAKVADLRYIVTLKDKPYIRVYIYRSSDDTKNYEVTTVRGKVTSCDTPAKQPCYICKDAQKKEWEREAARREQYCTDFAIYE